MDNLIDVLRFTSLLGGNGTGLLVLCNIGASEPCENVTDGESGPTLDLGLPCDETCIVDNLRIHESLFEETESLRPSAP